MGSAFPKPCLCGLRRLSRRSHAAVERRFYHAKTIQHTAPQPGSQNTHDRGRIRRVCRKAFCLQHEPSRVYPASHNRGSHMLNQANGDRQILAKQLNISPHQLSYVTHSGEGEGLLFFGNVILPFVDHFPKDLELYRILTTKLNEISEGTQK